MAKTFSINLDCGEPEGEEFQQYLKEHEIKIHPDPFTHVQETYDFSSANRENLEELINKFWIDQKQDADSIKEEQEFLFSFI